MSLIECQECGKYVYTSAASCPNCGSPISEPQETKVVIERTRKRYKKYLVLSVLVFLYGFFASLVDEKTNPKVYGWIMLIGVVGFIVTGALVWWNQEWEQE